MRSIVTLCNTPNPTAGEIVADGLIHPRDWHSGRRSMIYAGRVLRMPTGVDVWDSGSSMRSLPRNWREIAMRQGQKLD